MKNFILMTFLILGLNGETWAQKNFFLEISGGPSKSFLNYDNSAFEPTYRSDTRLAWHGSVTGYYGLSNELELGLQLDLVKRNHWRTFGNDPLSPFTFLGQNVFQTGLVIRKTFLNSHQRGFYLESGLSLLFPPSPYNLLSEGDPIDGIETGLIKSRLGLGLNAEIGYKFINLRNNYFLIGLRLQQGLYRMEQYNIPIHSNGQIAVHQVRSNGSFASAFLGYGINTSNWSKHKKKIPNRYYNQNKMIKNELANVDGFYLMAYGGFRVKQPITPREDFYFNSSGQFSMALGYKWSRYSLETGYGQFSGGNNISIGLGDFKWTDWVVYGVNNPFIPLTFKYDILISDWKTVRFGPSFGTAFLIRDNVKAQRTFSNNTIGWAEFPGQDRLDVTGTVRSIPIEKSQRFLFNAGMHLEFQVFNSSFMSLNLTRNFGSPVISNIEVDYLIGNNRYQFEQEATLNGFRFDFGWKLPLNILDKQKKLALKR